MLKIDDYIKIEGDDNKQGRIVEITDHLFAIQFKYPEGYAIFWFKQTVPYEVIKPPRSES